MAGFNWDKYPEVVEQLTSLWNGGMSSGQIAKELGRGLTRCSIIGKVHRLGLDSHASRPSKRTRPPTIPKLCKLSRSAVPKPALVCPPPACPPETFPDGKICQHITGHIGEPGWQMCANPVADGKKWCEYHHSKTVDLVRTAQVRAAQH